MKRVLQLNNIKDHISFIDKKIFNLCCKKKDILVRIKGENLKIINKIIKKS